MEEDRVREYLSKLDTQKSMSPDEVHPQVLRELASVIARSLSIIFDQSGQLGQVSEDWRKVNVISIFKSKKEDTGNCRLVSLTLVPGRVMKQLVLVTI